MIEARYFKRQDNKVTCLLCPHHCTLSEGQTGICGVRHAKGGILYTENYGACVSLALDPIEKKPLYHFFPGRDILSIGTIGCNFTCKFCQNWEIARGEVRPNRIMAPEDILNLLESKGGVEEQLGVAYTYNEPTVWFEFVFDTAGLLWENGYQNVLVTNGFICKDVMEELLPFVGAVNIDVKGFTQEFYRKYCGGKKDAVLENVALAAQKCHVEVTYLVIPSLNDKPEEIREFSEWLSGIDPEIPLHFSRYSPQYKLHIPPTPIETLIEARNIALEKMDYVYVGNVLDETLSSTYCPRCNALLIARQAYSIRNCGIEDGKCKACGKTIKMIEG